MTSERVTPELVTPELVTPELVTPERQSYLQRAARRPVAVLRSRSAIRMPSSPYG
jgi:hypothetical protein